MTASARPTKLDDVPGLNGVLARRAAEYQYTAFIRELKALEPQHWDAPTDCDRWSVKDVVAHLIGWMEAMSSFKELRHQVGAGFKRRKELGNILDAANEQQVEDRRSLTPEQLIARMEEITPGFVAKRARWGKVGRGVPIYDPVVMGATNLAYLFNVIFTRDAFMHRIDVARAAGREVLLDELDAVVLADVVKDWARRRGADATVSLDGVGFFVAGTGATATVTGSGAEFARVMTGRAEPSVLGITGDVPAATAWLAAGCPF